jgi:hypothetical protein
LPQDIQRRALNKLLLLDAAENKMSTSDARDNATIPTPNVGQILSEEFLLEDRVKEQFHRHRGNADLVRQEQERIDSLRVVM